MRRILISVFSVLALVTAALPVAAQTGAPSGGDGQLSKATKDPIEPKVEQIHHQDKSVTIDEVRVGGQTQSIEVKPSNTKLRPYEVEPQRGDAGISDASKTKGLTNRSWKLFNF